ncbi:MAG: hypothetical protein ACLUAR_19195 [Pilosibacter sp.]
MAEQLGISRSYVSRNRETSGGSMREAFS